MKEQIFQGENLDAKRMKNYFSTLFSAEKHPKIPYFSAFLPYFGRFWFHMKHSLITPLFHVKHIF